MATPTYDLLASTTLATTASSVTFSSIDQSYGDLILQIQANATSTTSYVGLRFNSDSASNYHYVTMQGTSSSSSSASGTTNNVQLIFGGYGDFDEAPVFQTSIFDYSATDKHKSLLTRAGNRERGQTQATAFRWASTTAINSIEIFVPTSTLKATSTFNLYGVAK